MEEAGIRVEAPRRCWEGPAHSFLLSRVLLLLKTLPLKGLSSPCLCNPGQPLLPIRAQEAG